jgi:DNA helicase II / ATP-dependent DNA helicase PcrA
MNIMRARMLTHDKWRRAVIAFEREWRQYCEDADRTDFTGLLERCLADVPAAPGVPRVFMADEAQDFSALEFALARKWGNAAETFVIVGDPDQCLYEWRGSNPLTFSEGEPSGVRVLSQSRRVPQVICDYSHTWIQRIADREPIEYSPRLNDPNDPSSGVAVGELARSRHTYRYPAPLLREVRKDLDEGMSVMILTSCSYMLKATIAELRERGMPFHNPYRIQHGGWNPLRYADRVAAFLKPQPVEAGGQNLPWTWGDVNLWIEPLKASAALTRGAKTMVEARCLPDRFAPVQPEDQVVPLERLYDETNGLLKPASFEPCFDANLDWYKESTRASRMNVVDYPVRVAQQFGGGALLDKPRLVVGTIHSVKGGEADSVYIFPDLSRQGGASWGMKGSNRYPILRQFYVGFTRARTKLTLCNPSGADAVPFPRT